MDVRTRQAGFREAMRRFPTGVTIVATMGADRAPAGLTVSSFTSVSLHPPLVLVCIDRASETHDLLVRGRGFAISVLSVGQADLAVRFSAKPGEGRFDAVAWHEMPSGQPVICGAAAWLDCVTHEILPGGDHSIILGRVESSGVGEEPAMVYHGGAFGSVGS